MAHIVYITNGMASTLHSSFELSRRLGLAGHRVTYVSHADIDKPVTLHGYPFIPLTGDRAFQTQLTQGPASRLRISRPDQWIRWVAQRRRIRRQSIENNEIEKTIDQLNPDLLLIDIECHFAIIATAKLAIPTVAPMVFFSTFKQPGLPPLHTTLMPATNQQQSQAITKAWQRLRLGNLARQWRHCFSLRAMRDALRPVLYSSLRYDDLKAVARSRGYALNAETSRKHWLRPFVYRCLPILCFNAWEMEFPHERRPNLHYVGPMIDKHRRETHVGAASASKWEQFKLNRQQSTNPPRPLIYCSLGTFWSADRAFLGRVLEVFKRRQDWDLILGLGGKLSADALGPTPPNALLLDWAPQLDALELADAAIAHGGATTVNECAYFKTPMVVYSTKHVEQNGNAARIAYHGLGIMADKDTDTPDHLERNLDRVLSDLTFRQNLDKMHAHLQAYEEDNTAIKFLEDRFR